MFYAIVAAAGLAVGADGPPTDAEILRALPKLTADGAVEVFRDDIVIVKSKLAEKAAGNVRAAHWQCVAYWTETTKAGDTTTRANRTVAVYIDKTRLVK